MVPGRTGGSSGTAAINSASDENPYPPETAGTTLVGSYKPNGWGLYDMHGNIWELCLDWNPQGDIYNLGGRINAYYTNYYDNVTGALVAVNPSSEKGAARFVTRGGAYFLRWDYALPGARRGGRGVKTGGFTGFRVVCPAVFH
jgi:formylglycine-generating enzyme required for sulfatase activity